LWLQPAIVSAGAGQERHQEQRGER
jgi:hypothetical protein